MSESSLYRLAQHLRRLARADVQLAPDGHRLAGEIHQEYELAYQQLSDLIDQVLDGHPLNDLQLGFIAQCKALVAAYRPLVRQLELDWA